MFGSVLSAAAIIGCARAPDSGEGGAASEGGTAGSGAASSDGGGGGAGWTLQPGDLPPPDPGQPGGDLVGAGTSMDADNYRLLVTLGRSSQNQAAMTSGGKNTKFRLYGGVIGATESGK